MKHLKRFNEDNIYSTTSPEDFNDVDNTVINPDPVVNTDPVVNRPAPDTPKISLSELSKIENELKQDLRKINFEDITDRLQLIKKNNPSITSVSPYKEIWWSIVKLWHNGVYRSK